MEQTSTTAEPSISVSCVESTGDSEADTAVSQLCITKTTASTDDDDDAESTSGDFVNAKEIEYDTDKNKRRSPVEASSKTIAQLVGKKKEKDEKEVARDDRAVKARGDAESDRRFWDACIAHGY